MNVLKCCTRGERGRDRGTSCISTQADRDREAERQRERETKLNKVLEDSKQLLKWLDESKTSIKKTGEFKGTFDIVNLGFV